MPLIPSSAHSRLLLSLVARPALHRRGFLTVLPSHGPDPEEEDPSQAHQHPSFKPGQMFKVGDEKYRIERKLRARSFSMVWLAAATSKTRDPVHSDRDFVALETFSALHSAVLAMSSKGQMNASMRYIHDLESEQKNGYRGSQYCDRTIRVHLGPHLCIERELCGPTLAELQATQPHRSFTLPVSKRIIQQTLLALDFMHTTIGRTHSGVNPYNLHVALLGLRDQLTEDIQSYLKSNPPEIEHPSLSARIGLSEGIATMPKARPLPAFGLSPSMDNLEVRLGRCELATLERDLEKSASDDDDESDIDALHASCLLSAPEVLRGSPRPFSTAVNIWAIGHLLFQCLTGEVVYTRRVWPLAGLSPKFRAIVGPGPEFPNWTELSSLCDPSVLERRLRSFPHISKETSDGDVKATCAFLSRCFRMDRAERPTAEQLLEDEWLQS